jgi:hypothetical protein
MDRTNSLLVIGIIIGALIFISFFISTSIQYHIIGIPSLQDFLAMCGLIVSIVCGFFWISYKTNNC